MIELSDFLNKYQKKPVIEYPNNLEIYKPKVSVLVFTYNHVNFIAKCLDSILCQITNFDFEIYLGEDESSDGTREVCIEYANRYPDKIRLILHHRLNNIMIDGSPSGRFNSLYGYLTSRGKYIALCEGDDCWIHPLKLQKQVDFMEKNPDCSLCFHPSLVVYADQSKPNKIAGPKDKMNKKEHKFLPNDLVSTGLGIWTVTMLFRSGVVKDLPNWFLSVRLGDLALKFICAAKGNIGFVGGEPMSVYNRGVVGAWSHGEGKSREWGEQRLRDHYQIYDNFNEYSGYKFRKEVEIKKKNFLLNYLKYNQHFYDKTKYAKFLTRHLRYLINFTNRKVVVIWLRFLLGIKGYNKALKCVKAIVREKRAAITSF